MSTPTKLKVTTVYPTDPLPFNAWARYVRAECDRQRAKNIKSRAEQQ